MRFFVKKFSFLLFIVMAFGCSQSKTAKKQIIIFHAGSLSVPFKIMKAQRGKQILSDINLRIKKVSVLL